MDFAGRVPEDKARLPPVVREWLKRSAEQADPHDRQPYGPLLGTDFARTPVRSPQPGGQAPVDLFAAADRFTDDQVLTFLSVAKDSTQLRELLGVPLVVSDERLFEYLGARGLLPEPPGPSVSATPKDQQIAGRTITRWSDDDMGYVSTYERGTPAELTRRQREANRSAAWRMLGNLLSMGDPTGKPITGSANPAVAPRRGGASGVPATHVPGAGRPAPEAPPAPAPRTTSHPDAARPEHPVPTLRPAQADYTPPSHQLPPHIEPEHPADYAGNIGSHGERVVEKQIADLRPNAEPMSAKAAGFDLFEGATTVAVTTETKGGTVIVDRRIRGGEWIQVKGISEARPELVAANVKSALERAANALKSGRQNAFERTGPGTAYRTSYAGPPDKVTILLKLETGAVDKAVLDAAARAVEKSPHTTELPPVSVMILGN
ncbi:hypothetical protein ACFWY9_07670 [Amycolatopsis sp. NPDC059027]|uniref:hypothetical protein n=1 Tax=Amycolatopsis sp. NPDC059027 TaxID=3346709 RepID=UPI003672A7FB